MYQRKRKSHAFQGLTNKSVKENQSPSDVYMVVSSTLTIRYDIIGSAPENEEELKERNSERDSAATTAPTFYYVPESRELIKRYVCGIFLKVRLRRM